MVADYTLDDKRILITGACGTVGAELLRQLTESRRFSPAEIHGLDSNESALFFMDQLYQDDPRVTFSVADIRDRYSMMSKLDGIDVLFHTAALKHVVLSERSPEQAVLTNIMGVQNIIEAANTNGLDKVIFTSSDKAVNPTNVMGTSKLMGERMMTAANSVQRSGRTVFASTRFGNVLGSNGSVFHIFKRQIEQGGPVTLTHKHMTRFIMSIEESAALIINTAQIARGGEVFVTKMPVIKICDLAQAMIQVFGANKKERRNTIDIVEIGSKPGEKLYEELMSEEETHRSLELPDYFVILPAFRGLYQDIDYDFDAVAESDRVLSPYVSAKSHCLSVEQIMQLLLRYGLSADVDRRSADRD